MSTRNFCCMGLLLLVALAVPGVQGATYIEVATLSDLAAGNAGINNHTMSIYAGGVIYSHVAKTTSPQDFAITTTTLPGGVPTSANLTTLASWTANVGAPASSRIFTGFGSAIVGSSLQIVNSNNGAGEGVFRIDTTTGVVSQYLAEADITAVTGAADPDIQNYSGVSPSGEAVFYEGLLDQILQTSGAGSVSVLVSSAQLAAAQGGDTTVSSGLIFDNSGNLYWGNNATDGLYMRDSGGTISEILSAADLAGIVGAGSNSYNGGLFLAPDGLMYFRFGSSSTTSILAFDPAAPDPAATLTTIIDKADLDAGPGGTSSVGPFSWYQGQIAWSTFSGGFYALTPEPATLTLLVLGGLGVLRRRR